jgi:N-acetylglucosamine-6-phosphate deacetylase
MLVIGPGDVVLRDRIVRGGSVVIEGDRIAAIDEQPRAWPADVVRIGAGGELVLPGFVDVHVHGVAGHDVLDEGDALAFIAGRLPRFGVTAFCPTTVACSPPALRRVLAQVRAHRAHPIAPHAGVLGAHLESNFINPSMRGAQPADCLRLPPGAAETGVAFSGADIMAVITEYRDEVSIVTVAPELPGGLDLVRGLAAMGLLVSLGHSSADFLTANAAFDAGARHATHLFNRMPPIGHREPGLAGAVLGRDEVTAELICDGYHVHPGVVRMAIATKGSAGIVAITDGTAGSGLPAGSCARLGGRPITVRSEAAFLEDGTLAGSTLTMDGAFRMLLDRAGQSVVDAAAMCATTPSRALNLLDRGVIAPGARADLVVLDRERQVAYTCVAGRVAYSREHNGRMLDQPS